MKVDFKEVNTLVDKLEYHFWQVPNTTVTVCVATLDGFQLGVGTSGCVDPAEFNADIGKQVAQDNALAQAKDQIWLLKGAALRADMFPGFLQA
ncbi:hypothetical protein D9891_23865 [Salmonella enterica]|nr:hypothetical protein [Salmonella enterica]